MVSHLPEQTLYISRLFRLWFSCDFIFHDRSFTLSTRQKLLSFYYSFVLLYHPFYSRLYLSLLIYTTQLDTTFRVYYPDLCHPPFILYIVSCVTICKRLSPLIPRRLYWQGQLLNHTDPEICGGMGVVGTVSSPSTKNENPEARNDHYSRRLLHLSDPESFMSSSLQSRILTSSWLISKHKGTDIYRRNRSHVESIYVLIQFSPHPIFIYRLSEVLQW